MWLSLRLSVLHERIGFAYRSVFDSRLPDQRLHTRIRRQTCVHDRDWETSFGVGVTALTTPASRRHKCVVFTQITFPATPIPCSFIHSTLVLVTDAALPLTSETHCQAIWYTHIQLYHIAWQRVSEANWHLPSSSCLHLIPNISGFGGQIAISGCRSVDRLQKLSSNLLRSRTYKNLIMHLIATLTGS